MLQVDRLHNVIVVDIGANVGIGYGVRELWVGVCTWDVLNMRQLTLNQMDGLNRVN